MNRFLRSFSWTVIFVFILLASVLSATAQKQNGIEPPLLADTAINPHDFTNEYLRASGINPKAIMGRRTGADGMSVFDRSSNPNHSDIRVIATVAGYDQTGGVRYWTPLGEFLDNGFTEDKIGFMARENAKLFPIYVFPDAKMATIFSTYANTRQAALIDDAWTSNSSLDMDLNPLGIRQIFVVTYTEKARGKEGVEMMAYFGKKNGLATDGTPVINSLEDLQFLTKTEMVMVDPLSLNDGKGLVAGYAISPVIADPTHGVIAPDAFLWMSTKDGWPLPSEAIFTWHFTCLQEKGVWCE